MQALLLVSVTFVTFFGSRRNLAYGSTPGFVRSDLRILISELPTSHSLKMSVALIPLLFSILKLGMTMLKVIDARQESESLNNVYN